MIFNFDMKSLTLIVLFAAVAYCQEVTDDATAVVLEQEARVGKRGLSVDGYNSYLSPSSRGLYRNYNNPISEFGGYDGVNYGIGSSNFAGGNYPGSYYQQQAVGNYPYRGGYPTSYVYQRQHNVPVNTYPLGGIGTVGPVGGLGGLGGLGGAYSGFNGGGYTGGYNRFGSDGIGYGGYQQQFGGAF